MNDFVKRTAVCARERTGTGWTIFVPAPGRGLTSVNDALDEKFCDGWRKAKRKGDQDLVFKYNEIAREVRTVVTLACRPIGAIQGLMDLRFVVCPHKEWDDDAWLLIAKWCIDGMTDAGLWKKDRRAVREISGRIERSYLEPAGVTVEIVRVPS